MSAHTLQLSPQAKSVLPTHVAIIMDGNGRWAQRRGWFRVRGHVAGMESVRVVTRLARRLGRPAASRAVGAANGANPVPILILYWTAWPAEDGAMNFRPDVYGRDGAVLSALNAPFSFSAAVQ